MSEANTKKILVVEDEKTILDPLSAALTGEGFVVLTSADGAQGFELARVEHPDLILLDIDLPTMDGLTLMKKLRGTDDYGKNVKIILITNSKADDEIIQHIAEDEPSYFLTKSEWTPEGIIQKAKEALGILKPESTIPPEPA